MSISRTPPVPKYWNTAPWGTCRWCNKPIFNADGTPHTRRRWHEKCLEDYHFCRGTSHRCQPAVAGKTENRCASCKSNLQSFKHDAELLDPALMRLADIVDYEPQPTDERGYRSYYRGDYGSSSILAGVFSPVSFDVLYMRVQDFRGSYVKPAGAYCSVSPCWISWQIDHIIPLWLVDRTLPFKKLIEYWRIGNLQALCDTCHKAKTAKEAADRAKMKRIQLKQAGYKRVVVSGGRGGGKTAAAKEHAKLRQQVQA